jgi:hypothetical protein
LFFPKTAICSSRMRILCSWQSQARNDDAEEALSPIRHPPAILPHNHRNRGSIVQLGVLRSLVHLHHHSSPSCKYEEGMYPYLQVLLIYKLVGTTVFTPYDMQFGSSSVSQSLELQRHVHTTHIRVRSSACGQPCGALWTWKTWRSSRCCNRPSAPRSFILFLFAMS